ncbi:S9 family peptidase [Silvibacterium dinghuense]|uniref:S9 family peptidase n=2 Tax=Silvibacterium dinghuense TaxID=1560006 RepID=A0A4Q1SA25_9BACT|nr:S9 family peptidase [Silvibacterium dinghuense]
MTFEDMMKMRRLGEIAVSPDGRWVMYSATDVSLAQNTKTSHLWMVPVAGGESHALLAWEAGESRGRFSPDGKQILFESTREGGQQIWLADFDGATGKIGEPHKLTSLSTETDGAMWSPDGKSILFTSAVYPECNDDSCNQQKDEASAESKVKAQVFTHLLYRHWDHFTGDKRSHLFLVSADGSALRDLTPGDGHDVPPFSMGGPDQYAFAPDGKEIAFEENLDPVAATSTNSDIFTLRLDDANAKPVKISTAAGGDHSPAYSPDGKSIAWRSQARAGYESDRFRLVVYDRASKKITEPLPDFDRWIDEFVWAPDSQKIYFAAGDLGEEPVFVTSLDGKQSSELTDEGTYGDLHVTPDGKTIVAARQTVRVPGDVVALETDRVRKAAAGMAHRRVTYASPTDLGMTQTFFMQKDVTHLNAVLLEALDLSKMEHYWFSSLGRVRVEGFILRPPGFDETKKYPVKMLIHGGPQGEWGDSWSYRWNAELFAANGYVVVMINPGGSVGYGQAFVDRVNRDWGGKPYLDLMNGMTAAEVKYPFIDKSRECALGASYGGFMADWILGHTDRFRCIVTHDGMFNPESAYGTTEELWFNEWEFGSTPWTNRAMYRRWSPMLSAPRMKTPTLVIHSQHDYRLDVSEGYQLFTTLQRMGVPSKMLYFPDESHWVTKPQNSQLWYKTVNDWVDQWTK